MGSYNANQLSDNLEQLGIPSTAYSIFPKEGYPENVIIALTLCKPIMNKVEELLFGIGFQLVK